MEIVAECGINHNGDLDTAIELIYAAKECGADVVKFQYFMPEILCANRNNYDALDILRKNKMHYHWLPILKKECDKLRIEFLCTPFCKFTAEDVEPHVKRFKIAATEVNLEFVKEVAKYGKPLILSVGKVSQKELDKIMSEVNVPVTLLYCVVKYPALPEDYDLTELDRLRKRYKVPIGLSDHTQGIKTAIEAAKKYNADVIEKHFMLEDGNCIDKEVSLTPKELLKLINIIRRKV